MLSTILEGLEHASSTDDVLCELEKYDSVNDIEAKCFKLQDTSRLFLVSTKCLLFEFFSRPR